MQKRGVLDRASRFSMRKQRYDTHITILLLHSRKSSFRPFSGYNVFEEVIIDDKDTGIRVSDR